MEILSKGIRPDICSGLNQPDSILTPVGRLSLSHVSEICRNNFTNSKIKNILEAKTSNTKVNLGVKYT